MANTVLRALMGGIAGGAQGYIQQRQREQDDADKAYERQFRERQFKQQIVDSKASRYLQEAQLAMEAQGQKRLSEQDQREQDWHQQQLSQADTTQRRSDLLEQGKLSGFIPSPDALNAGVAAGKLGLNTPGPIEEVLSAARARSMASRQNVDIPGQGTVVYGYNPNDSQRASMYNSDNDERTQYLTEYAKLKLSASNAVHARYVKENPELFSRDPAQTANIEAQANAEAQRAGDEYADVVWQATGGKYDLNGKHKPQPGGPKPKAKDWRNKYDDVGDSPPSAGSPSASPASAGSNSQFDKYFKY